MRIIFRPGGVVFFAMVGLTLLVGIHPAWSQDLRYSDDLLEQCAANAEGPASLEGCIGLAATQCQAANGDTNYALSGCLSQEVEWWEKRLNSVYQQVLAEARALDAELAGASVPSQGDALRDAQRAWIPFRDATCTYEASLWGGGTGAGPAYLNCLLHMTADQVIYLEQAGLK